MRIDPVKIVREEILDRINLRSRKEALLRSIQAKDGIGGRMLRD
jgi:hypothetical protein